MPGYPYSTLDEFKMWLKQHDNYSYHYDTNAYKCLKEMIKEPDFIPIAQQADLCKYRFAVLDLELVKFLQKVTNYNYDFRYLFRIDPNNSIETFEYLVHHTNFDPYYIELDYKIIAPWGDDMFTVDLFNTNIYYYVLDDFKLFKHIHTKYQIDLHHIVYSEDFKSNDSDIGFFGFKFGQGAVFILNEGLDQAINELPLHPKFNEEIYKTNNILDVLMDVDSIKYAIEHGVNYQRVKYYYMQGDYEEKTFINVNHNLRLTLDFVKFMLNQQLQPEHYHDLYLHGWCEDIELANYVIEHVLPKVETFYVHQLSDMYYKFEINQYAQVIIKVVDLDQLDLDYYFHWGRVEEFKYLISHHRNRLNPESIEKFTNSILQMNENQLLHNADKKRCLELLEILLK